MMRSFDLVVFDLGGVLIQFARSWADMHERAGLSGEPLRGADWHHRWTDIEKLMETGAIDDNEGHRRMAAASAGRYGPQDIRRARSASLIEQHPGVGEVFDALEAGRIETALLSNVTEIDWTRLEPGPAHTEPEFPIALRASYRYASHLIGARKPDRPAFDAVERGTGRSPDQILFFDDRPDNVEASRASGWTAELIDHAGDTAAQLLAALRRHEVIA